MWLELPSWAIWLLNLIAISVFHFGVSWCFTQLDHRRFAPTSFLFRERSWERGGEVYQRYVSIRSWKRFIPDAAPWLQGMAKGRLAEADPHYLRRFIVETCRGEAAHYAQGVSLLLTLLWNPWPIAGGVMLAYAILSNAPCILLQRFTRARLRHLLDRLTRERHGA